VKSSVFLFFIILIILLISCKKEIDNLIGHRWIKYTIEEGEHSSTVQIAPFHGTQIKFKVIFNETAKYTSVDPINQWDVNKLFGFSDCNSQHHENSARVGWRWLNDKLELLAYVYVNGVETNEKICDVNFDEEIYCEIVDMGEHYKFIVNDSTVTMNRGCSNKGGLFRYYLFFYFGGDEKAPHDITVKIKEIK
jgi:hypothetical protein